MAAQSSVEGTLPGEAEQWLKGALALPPGASPFPWQRRLLRRLLRGEVPSHLDLPTGLGKTSVMGIWLVAKALGAPLPRRLVYIVDRRAVVDQATHVAEGLRQWVRQTPAAWEPLGLRAGGRIPISTLRGKFVDNREWLEDPASSSIVVGTVDMIGSRLLFRGYGVSRKMRPYHAGMLGVDSLIVLDESHLVPAFADLLDVLDGRGTRGEEGPWGSDLPDSQDSIVPRWHVMMLSATHRSSSGTKAFQLDEKDESYPEVTRRLRAVKRISMVETEGVEEKGSSLLVDTMAQAVLDLVRSSGDNHPRLLVFCNSRKDAKSLFTILGKSLVKEEEAPPSGRGKRGRRKKVPIADIELFVGGRRVFERVAAARRLRELGFIAGSSDASTSRPAVLVATSAAEVGVDLDADHMVCDLVSWDRMVQRLGRVNRRGRGHAQVRVVVDSMESGGKKKKKSSSDGELIRERLRATRQLIERLPVVGSEDGSSGPVFDGSPKAISDLTRRAKEEESLSELLERSSSAAPLRPLMTRSLLDSWSMTSLEEDSSRPDVAPWLRGWASDSPRIVLAWRAVLPVDGSGRSLAANDVESFFEAAPVHLSEQLEVEVSEAADWIKKRLKAVEKGLRSSSEPSDTDRSSSEPSDLDPVEGDALQQESGIAPLKEGDAFAFWLGTNGTLHKVYSLGTDASSLSKDIGSGSGVLVLDRRFGGVENGLLNSKSEDLPPVADLEGDDWIRGDNGEPIVQWRVRKTDAFGATAEPGWHERFRVPYQLTEEGDPVAWLVVDKWRHSSSTEEDRSASHPQLLEEHLRWTAERAADLARRLGLRPPWSEVLVRAAELHDLGKSAARWQLAFRAPSDGTYAKTKGPIDPSILGGYRHEFGSLLQASADPALRAELKELRARWGAEAVELLLHLVVAHHGYGRPWIPVRGCEQAPPSRLRQEAERVAARFVVLQQRWGPWGLAWWETLLRAADQQASRDNDARAFAPKHGTGEER